MSSINNENRIMYQLGNLKEFCAGHFEGITSREEVLKHGDLGIGTFEGGDGEMIVLEGVMYQATEFGDILPYIGDEPVPLANLAFFRGEIALGEMNSLGRNELEALLDRSIDPEKIYMLKLCGKFSHIRARSEKGQKPPYVSLKEFLAYAQREFEFKEIEGTMVAVYTPERLKEISGMGWHYHFIDKDRTKGGHVLEFRIAEAYGYMDAFDDMEF